MALASWEVWRFGSEWPAGDAGTIELDTTPPSGELTLVAAVAGQVARVAYELDEAAAISAVLHLADDRDLPMLVTGTTTGELAVDLPADAPSSGEVRLLVRDALANEQTILLAIAIEGATAAEPQPSGGSPGERLVHGARLIRLRGRARARVSTQQRVSITSRSAARVRIRYTLATQAPPARAPAPRPVPQAEDHVLSTTVQIRVRMTTRTTAAMGTHAFAIGYGRQTIARELDPAVLELLDLL